MFHASFYLNGVIIRYLQYVSPLTCLSRASSSPPLFSEIFMWLIIFIPRYDHSEHTPANFTENHRGKQVALVSVYLYAAFLTTHFPIIQIDDFNNILIILEPKPCETAAVIRCTVIYVLPHRCALLHKAEHRPAAHAQTWYISHIMCNVTCGDRVSSSRAYFPKCLSTFLKTLNRNYSSQVFMSSAN